uniref:Secreted protein n=1 Tax=Streptomyces sp. NBC_01393 TaxID=2903851 RepID=A0AAU3I215_9ACTN
MASIRTARVLAAVAALPLAAALFSGVAAADNGSFADTGSNAGVATAGGSGAGRDNSGNSSATQQQAVGSGASNQSNTAQVNGSAFTALNQGNSNVLVNFVWL